MSDAPAGFPVSRCAACARDVLVHALLDADGRERLCCVACDAEIDPAAVRWLAEGAIAVLGYRIEGALETGGCGRPGCGGGRCGQAVGPPR